MRLRLLTTVSSTKQILKQNTLYYIVAITGYLETLNCVKQNGFPWQDIAEEKNNVGLGAWDLQKGQKDADELLEIERLISRLHQTADVNFYHVTKFPPYLPFTLYCFHARIIMPVLTIGIVRHCYYLLIFYSEKFSTWVWRLLKCLNGLAPPYLCQKFKTRSEVHNCNTRNRDRLHIPLCRTAAGQRAFTFRGQKLW